jgi:hypothetical protein
VWIVIEARTPEGQQTSLLASDYEAHETQFLAAFLKDQNTPNVTHPLLNGDDMRSKYLRILLENNSTTPTKLFFLNVGYALSGRPYN